MLDPTIATPRERVCVCGQKSTESERKQSSSSEHLLYEKLRGKNFSTPDEREREIPLARNMGR